MKKNYLLAIAAVLSASVASAQLVLTKAAYENVVGDVETSQNYDTVSTLPRNTGQNQLWNFSSITQSTNGVTTTNYVAPSTVPGSSLFPTATVASDVGNGTYTFYKSASTPTTQFESLGYDNTSASVVCTYTNTQVNEIWPITYGTSYSDTYSGQMTGQTTGTRQGTITVTGSGTGTIILPGGTQYSNVLQLKVTEIDVQVTNYTPPLTYTFATTGYAYFRAGEKSAILTVGDIAISSGTMTSLLSGVSTATTTNSSVPTGISKQSNALQFSVFPNPAKTEITLALSNPFNEACTVEIYNMLGGCEARVNAGKASEINLQLAVSDLKPGIYFVKTQLGHNSSVKKLIIE